MVKGKNTMDMVKSWIPIIGVVIALGGGFIKYGEIKTQLEALSNIKQEKVDLAPLDKKITNNGQKIADNNKSSAVNATEIELLKLQIEEIKVSTSNPLSTQ